MKDTQISMSEVTAMQASKWLQHQVLLDTQEMSAFLHELGDFQIYLTSQVVPFGQGEISKEEFLNGYACYVSALKAGELPDEQGIRHLFSAAFSRQGDHFFRILVEGNRHLVRVSKPVVQLQAHRIDYSKADGKFRSMTFGADAIAWGLQFSYPQLFKDSKTAEVHRIGGQFPNTELFQKLQRWIRHHTVPTRLQVENHVVDLPIRIGKSCFSWINCHPHLAKRGIQVLSWNNVKRDANGY